MGVEDDEGRGRRTVLSFLFLESELTVLTSIQTHKYAETQGGLSPKTGAVGKTHISR